jgi:lysophospholipase L1-like esterase
LIAALLAAMAGFVSVATPASAEPYGTHWTGAWSAAAQPSNPGEMVPNASAKGFADQTVRQVIRVSAGGAQVRVRVSNAYGKAPLTLTGATVGKARDGARVWPGTLRPVTFGRLSSTVVAPSREAISDPVRLPVSRLESLAVTLYFAEPTGPATFHQFATATAYTADGDHRFDVRGKEFTDAGQSRYFLSGIDVTGASQAAVVTFGDSITDGVGSTPDTDNRYPDELAERLTAAHRPLTVLNAGIGGNKVLNDSGCFGESQLARFQRDALDQPGVRTVILQGGLNDLGAPLLNDDCVRPNPRVTAEQLIEGFKTLINAARTRGITAIGTTITPMRGSIFDSDEGERVRDAVNEWIRTSGAYDAVVDFDRVLADGDHLRAGYDSGDHLHPNDTGYRAMAQAIDLSTL